MQRFNLKSLFIKITLSAAFFCILFASVSTTEFQMHLSNINPLFFILSLLVIPVVIPTNCLKWKILIEHQGRPVKFYYLLRVYCIGYFFSNLLPSNVGGDVMRAYYLGRHFRNASMAAVSVFIERLSGIVALMALSVLAPLLQPSLYKHGFIYVTIIGALLFLIIIIGMLRIDVPSLLVERFDSEFLLKGLNGNAPPIFSKTNNILSKIQRFCKKILLNAITFHKKLLNAMHYLKDDTPVIFRVAVLTLFFYVMTWINIYVSFRAFSVQPDFVAICAVTPAAMLVAMAPVTMLGNIGFTEGVYVVFFSLIGIDPSASLAMSLLLRFKMLLMGSCGMVFYLMHHRQ